MPGNIVFFFPASFLRTYFYNTTVKNPKRYQNRILFLFFFLSFHIIIIIIFATLGEKISHGLCTTAACIFCFPLNRPFFMIVFFVASQSRSNLPYENRFKSGQGCSVLADSVRFPVWWLFRVICNENGRRYNNIYTFNFNGIRPSAYIAAETPLKIHSYYLLVSSSTHFLTLGARTLQNTSARYNNGQKPRAIGHGRARECLCGPEPIAVSFN